MNYDEKCIALYWHICEQISWGIFNLNLSLQASRRQVLNEKGQKN
jgi:hypothetical protein